MTKTRRSLNCWDYEAIRYINCSDLRQEQNKIHILDFGSRAFTTKSGMNNRNNLRILKSFIEKHKDQLNQNQIESFNLVIKNVEDKF